MSAAVLDEQISETQAHGATVGEIHLDFLLWEELSADEPFLRRFVQKCTGADELSQLLEVRRSVSDRHGEADLLVRYKSSRGDVAAILIEDKIGAAFQPDQALRYERRGEEGKPKQWNRFTTCLVASQKYIDEGHGFKTAIPIEVLRDWISASDERRRSFRLEILSRAIDQVGKRGPQTVDPIVTRFRMSYFEALKSEVPELEMHKPKPAGPSEVWFNLRHSAFPKGAYVLHKANLGVVDLTIPNVEAERLQRLTPRLEFGMSIKQTGKSSAVRLSVPVVQAFDDFSRELPSVRLAFDAAMRLAFFAAREQEALGEAIRLSKRAA